MVRIDMSEYGEKHSVARLVGAPPGYVGYEEGGQLTEAVRRRPVHRRPARRGREGAPRGVRRPAAGARRRPPHRRPGPHGRLPQRDPGADVATSARSSSSTRRSPRSTKREAVLDAVRAAFKPEFLNRLDDVVVFDALGTEELSRIVELQVGRPGQAPGGAPAHARRHAGGPRVAGAHRATTRPTAPGRCAGSCSARSATGWPGRCSPARSATATRSSSTRPPGSTASAAGWSSAVPRS